MEAQWHKGRAFYFTKLDIKDGFWHLVVSNEDAWNFTYVLPSNEPNGNLNNIEIVVPNSLQIMHACQSIPFAPLGFAIWPHSPPTDMMFLSGHVGVIYNVGLHGRSRASFIQMAF